MPTYEYECRKCGHTFEKFQSMTEERIKTCPKCRGKVERLIGTGAGIIFKGSGFYETDYRSSSYQKEAQKASTPSRPAKADDTKPAETKSAADSSTSGSKDSKTAKGTSGA